MEESFSAVTEPARPLRLGVESFLSRREAFVWTVSGVVLTGYRSRFYVDGYRDALFRDLKIEFPAHLHRAVSKRRGGYLAGRCCARQLLSAIGCGNGNENLCLGTGRTPAWPSGVYVSISHTHDSTVCLGTLHPEVLGGGVDVEVEVSAPIAEEIQRHVVGDTEHLLIEDGFERYTQGMTAVLSAKESFYKASSKLTNRSIDFHALKLSAVHREEMVFRLVTDRPEGLPAGKRIAICYKFDHDTVETAVCLLREPMPRAPRP